MKFILVLCVLTTVFCNEVEEPHCSLICPRIYRPVCGTNYVTYSNECTMKGQLCLAGLSEVVKVLHQGPCNSNIKG
ncbi:PI-actitoxin-Avd5a-like isoform X2 [Gigantopelta aegis]|uniref:PI-actitoxin-Avd5a-like isoform X2 n=1 Tax=Gigantopelta aegis TaxID=1735272 RepID=UPI001B88944C|nr:PI-actitoxin-Avd5a-like isoform X2 [Gigantopelta aegis]